MPWTSQVGHMPFFGKQPAGTSDVVWTTPDLVVGVAYGGWTEADGLPRHASFQGVREDNPSGEVTPPERPARRSKVTSNPASLGITHPDRVLWPATNETPDVTKADLAACYALHVDRTLARIGGRPLSINRSFGPPMGLPDRCSFSGMPCAVSRV